MSSHNEIPQLEDVCLVANLQTVGPIFVTSVKDEIFDHKTGSVLAARIVITSGLGDITTGKGKLNGPIPIAELELDDSYECYYMPMDMVQQPLPDRDYSTGKGSFVICLLIPSDIKSLFQPFESQMEQLVQGLAHDIDFSKSVTGEIQPELKTELKKHLETIYSEVNQILGISSQFSGGSLFDIGLIATLPENLSKTAKQIMLNPKGMPEQDIEDKMALKTLFQAGLIEKKEQEGNTWIIPR